MKRRLSILLALVLCLSLLPMTTLAAGDTLKDIPLPKPMTPNYFVAGSEYETHDHTIRIVTVFDNSMVQLATEEDVDSEAFWAKYGVTNEGYYEFNLRMQYDVNIDGRGWQYTPAWDEDLYGYTGAYDMGYDYNGVREDLVSGFTFADMYWENTRTLYGDMVYLAGQDEYGDDIWRLDLENHSAQVRCRYIMAYISNDEWVIRTGDWSDVAVIGKGSTQRTPSAPTSYAAPIISNMRVIPPEEYQSEAHVYFELDTPDAVWDAEVYYAMNDEWGLDELDAQINVNGSGWETVYVSNSHWPLYEGDRQTSSTKAITEESHVQLRVRYGGSLGYSDWSNVLEVNAPNFEASNWAQSFLEQADELGLIPECLEGQDMREDIDRREFAAVCVKVYEALGNTTAIPAVNNPFTDTNDVEVLKAYNAGITSGTSETTFTPDKLLNRQEAATMLTNTYKRVTVAGWESGVDYNHLLGYEDYMAENPFADHDNISGWARPSVYFMAKHGIISGLGNNKFGPRNVTSQDEANGYANATREQALTIAVQMVNKLGN